MSFSPQVLILPSWYPATPEDIGGSFFRKQAIALAQRGVKVGVVTPKLRSLRQWRTVFTGPYGSEYVQDCGVYTYRCFGMAWFPRMPRLSRWLWLREGRQLVEQYMADHGMPDVIHVHSMRNAGLLALELHKRHGIPYVVTEHSSGFARGLVSEQQVSLCRKVARQAERRFAVSEKFCELLTDELGKEQGVWEPMPNIVEKQFLDRAISDLAENRDEFRFLTVANLTDNKRVHNLIEAFAKQFSGDHRVILEVGGDGPERPRLEALSRELGVNDRIHFLGALTRDQVVDAMASADAFVLPSHYETFGVVIIEALALGKPVIATRCGGPESILQVGDGILVPPDDVDAIGQALVDLRAGISRYDPEAIRHRCRDRFSEGTIMSKLTQVYEQIFRST